VAHHRLTLDFPSLDENLNSPVEQVGGATRGEVERPARAETYRFNAVRGNACIDEHAFESLCATQCQCIVVLAASCAIAVADKDNALRLNPAQTPCQLYRAFSCRARQRWIATTEVQRWPEAVELWI
jgi:hypothetical protein